MHFMDYLGNKSAVSINKYLNKDKEEFEKLKYGIKVFFINITKITAILSVAYCLNILKYTFLYVLTFAIIRTFAFGIHATSSFKCTLFNFLVFIGGTYLSLYLRLDNYFVLIIFAVNFILLALYAPSDTKTRPITSKKLRKKLKVNSLVSALIFMITALIIPNNLYKSIISFAALSEACCITPLIYKIFKKEYRNYEKINKQQN